MEPAKRVVVCGGGVIGVCTAYYLSKKGAAVTIVEKTSIACAASGKAGGFLALDWCDGGSVSPLARASFNLHRILADELNGEVLYGYRPVTTLSLRITETTSSSTSTSRTESNRTLPPWVNGPAKGSKTIGTPETTAQVHPQLFTKTLASKAVEDYGVQVVIGKVVAVETAESATKTVVLENGGQIEADAVVLALGPWTSKLPLVDSSFPVYGLKANSIVLQPRDPDVFTPHALFLSYFPAEGNGDNPLDPEVYPRPTAGEVYICGMSAEAEVPDDPESVLPVPESIAVLRRVAGVVSSHLGGGFAEVKAEQACFLPCSDDDLPIIGELPGVKGCYVATGHSCWGILNGPATGAAVSELVMDGSSEIVDIGPFSPASYLKLATIRVKARPLIRHRRHDSNTRTSLDRAELKKAVVYPAAYLSTAAGRACLLACFMSGTKPNYLGVQKNRPGLALCPATNNLEGRGSKNPVSREEAIKELLTVIESTKTGNSTPKVAEKRDDYIRVEYECPILGFVDDVEFWFPAGSKSVVEYRSASRIGNFDFDMNRKRIKRVLLGSEFARLGGYSIEFFPSSLFGYCKRAELALAVLYLNKAEARDKICRAIQYGSKFLSNGEPGTAQNVDKTTSLVVQGRSLTIFMLLLAQMLLGPHFH
ncbi:hypothetical protein M569_04640 [Genlisea aurea]|uniref:FAD dependent oxidoreductase domain-containing protein n=1 Tax=Genlisea aurea TaxID=192259 RepID=S8CS84_9LAMI|nr:hypothetical protein M569_04640 [Genlisea aurea]